MQKWIIIGVIILIVIFTGIILFNTSIETEYIPEEEISNLDLRKSMVNLYYRNIETQEIQAETRLIDSKELLQDPYCKLVQFLINGPESNELQKIIPENVKLIGVTLEKSTIKVKFSREILINGEINSDVVESVTKTLTQLNEIQDVIIEVENEENVNINLNQVDNNNNVDIQVQNSQIAS